MFKHLGSLFSNPFSSSSQTNTATVTNSGQLQIHSSGSGCINSGLNINQSGNWNVASGTIGTSNIRFTPVDNPYLSIDYDGTITFCNQDGDEIGRIVIQDELKIEGNITESAEIFARVMSKILNIPYNETTKVIYIKTININV